MNKWIISLLYALRSLWVPRSRWSWLRGSIMKLQLRNSDCRKSSSNTRAFRGWTFFEAFPIFHFLVYCRLARNYPYHHHYHHFQKQNVSNDPFQNVLNQSTSNYVWFTSWLRWEFICSKILYLNLPLSPCCWNQPQLVRWTTYSPCCRLISKEEFFVRLAVVDRCLKSQLCRRTCDTRM